MVQIATVNGEFETLIFDLTALHDDELECIFKKTGNVLLYFFAIHFCPLTQDVTADILLM